MFYITWSDKFRSWTDASWGTWTILSSRGHHPSVTRGPLWQGCHARYNWCWKCSLGEDWNDMSVTPSRVVPLASLCSQLKPLIWKASMELCSAGESGPAWTRAACLCVPACRDPVHPGRAGDRFWGAVTVATRNHVCPVCSCLLVRTAATVVPGLQVIRRWGMVLTSILHRLIWLVSLYHHSLLISSRWGCNA